VAGSHFALVLVAWEILAVSLFFITTIWYDFIEFYFGFSFNRKAVFMFAVLLCRASTVFRIVRAPDGILEKYDIPLVVGLYFTLIPNLSNCDSLTIPKSILL
jgi:hypothetical protein